MSWRPLIAAHPSSLLLLAASPQCRAGPPNTAVAAAFSNGAMVPAAAPDVDRERFFRQLMTYGGIVVTYGGIVVAAVPAVVWLVMVVPGWG